MRKSFQPIDIIYKPVKKNHEIVNCYFAKKLNFFVRGTYREGNDEKIKQCTAWHCYFSLNYNGIKNKYNCHIENCAGQPSFVYNFNTKNLLTFEENIKTNV